MNQEFSDTSSPSVTTIEKNSQPGMNVAVIILLGLFALAILVLLVWQYNKPSDSGSGGASSSRNESKDVNTQNNQRGVSKIDISNMGVDRIVRERERAREIQRERMSDNARHREIEREMQREIEWEREKRKEKEAILAKKTAMELAKKTAMFKRLPSRLLPHKSSPAKRSVIGGSCGPGLGLDLMCPDGVYCSGKGVCTRSCKLKRDAYVNQAFWGADLQAHIRRGIPSQSLPCTTDKKHSEIMFAQCPGKNMSDKIRCLEQQGKLPW